MGWNLSALCIVDSNKREQYEILKETIWAPGGVLRSPLA